MQIDRKRNKECGQMENGDGEEEQQRWICRGSSGEELRFVEAGDPHRILKAEFAWLDDLFVEQEPSAKKGDNRVMRMTAPKRKSMDRTAAVPKKHRFGENRQVHVLTGKLASLQGCKLDLLHCQEIFIKPFVTVPLFLCSGLSL